MIPSEAKPHEVAILYFWQKGMNSKQIAHVLHYRYIQSVNKVIARWREQAVEQN